MTRFGRWRYTAFNRRTGEIVLRNRRIVDGFIFFV